MLLSISMGAHGGVGRVQDSRFSADFGIQAHGFGFGEQVCFERQAKEQILQYATGDLNPICTGKGGEGQGYGKYVAIGNF